MARQWSARCYGARKSQNSLLNSLIAGKSRGDGRAQHCVASQRFPSFLRQLERAPEAALIPAFSPTEGVSSLRIKWL
jgi:hypothetical protein